MNIKKIIFGLVFFGVGGTSYAAKKAPLSMLVFMRIEDSFKQLQHENQKGAWTSAKLFERYKLVIELYYNTIKRCAGEHLETSEVELQIIDDYFRDLEKGTLLIRFDRFVNIVSLMTVLNCKLMAEKRTGKLINIEKIITFCHDLTPKTILQEVPKIKAFQLATFLLKKDKEKSLFTAQESELLTAISKGEFAQEWLPFIFDADLQDPMRGIFALNYLAGVGRAEEVVGDPTGASNQDDEVKESAVVNETAVDEVVAALTNLVTEGVTTDAQNEDGSDEVVAPSTNLVVKDQQEDLKELDFVEVPKPEVSQENVPAASSEGIQTPQQGTPQTTKSWTNWATFGFFGQ